MTESIRITEDCSGAPDGLNVQQYEEGETYEVGTTDMSEDLAEILLAAGQAEPGPDFASASATGAGEGQPDDESGDESDSEDEGGGEEGREEPTDEPPTDEEPTPDEEGGESESATGEWEMEQTAEGSPYFKFRKPNGEYLRDGEGELVKVLGEENADKKLQELKG